jgi:membrane protein YdbS with pleckstrin-like domain
MTTRLARIKRVLTMDAEEALEPLMLRLVLLFRRYPRRMHALGFLVTGVNAAAIWVFAGPRFVAWSFGLLWLWLLVVIVAWYVRERLGRNP